MPTTLKTYYDIGEDVTIELPFRDLYPQNDPEIDSYNADMEGSIIIEIDGGTPGYFNVFWAPKHEPSERRHIVQVELIHGAVPSQPYGYSND